MKSEYTKGKWKVVVTKYKDKYPSIHIYREEAKEPIIGYGTGKVICEISNTDSLEAVANAYLIAKSPCMAELLQRLVDDGWNAGISEEAQEILKALAGVEE